MALSKSKEQDRKTACEKHVTQFLLKKPIEPALNPIILKLCNGGFSYPFSRAFIHHSADQDQDFILGSFDLDAWYEHSYLELCNVLADEKEIEVKDVVKFECLFDFTSLSSGNHLTCLKLLLEGDLTELKIATIMALHYFKPLVPDGYYVIDKQYQTASSDTICKGCQQTINYDDTSIGNIRVWHGRVDILLKRNVVKVFLEEDLKNLDPDGFEEDPLFDENSGYACDQGDDIPTEIPQQFELIEVNCMSNFQKSCKAQLFAETIVNAFYISKKESNRNQFIPSFLATEKYIRIVLYNVAKDIFLTSSLLPIWEDGELNALTIIRVWLALNYSDILEKNEIVQFTRSSKFKEMMSQDTYLVYTDKLQQPMKQEKFKKKSEDDPNAFDRKLKNDEKRVARGKIQAKLVNHAKRNGYFTVKC